MNEGLAAQGQFGGKQGDEAEHGHTAVELFGTVVETPACSASTTSMRGSVAKALRRPPSSVVTVAPRTTGAEEEDWDMGIADGLLRSVNQV